VSVWFVAGAGTDIGKTYVTACLVRQLRAAGRPVRALKPVASGVADIASPAFASSDTAVLLDAQGLTVDAEAVEACTPWRFTAPLSPDMAAAAEGRSLRLADVRAWCEAQVEAAGADTVVLIEGVGGVMSPITSDALNLDLMKALACPAILVGGTYLGALSHTLTALETLRARAIEVRAVVLSETEGSTVGFDASVASMRRFVGAVEVVTSRRGARSVPLALEQAVALG
jgi:dethiobiotin synthetase